MHIYIQIYAPAHRGGLGLGGSVYEEAHEEVHLCFPCFVT